MFPGLCTLSVFQVMWTKLQTGSVFVFRYGERKAGRRTVTWTGHCYWTTDTYDTISREHDSIRPPSHIFLITKYEYWRFLVHCTHWSHRYTHLFYTEFLYNTSVPPRKESPVKPRICVCSNFLRQSKSVRNSRSSQQCYWRFRCFEMWCSITGRVVSDVLKGKSDYFWGQAVQKKTARQ
jgi:hypothetical protein